MKNQKKFPHNQSRWFQFVTNHFKKNGLQKKTTLKKVVN